MGRRVVIQAERLEQERQKGWRERAQRHLTMTMAQRAAMIEDIEPSHPTHIPDPEEINYCPECGAQKLVVPHKEWGFAVCANPTCGAVLQVG